jgi:hypothetical protein
LGLLGERAFEKGVADSLQRLKRAAEEKMRPDQIGKVEKGMT